GAEARGDALCGLAQRCGQAGRAHPGHAGDHRPHDRRAARVPIRLGDSPGIAEAVRRRLTLPLAAVLGAGIGVLPAVATGTSTTASFTAVDFGWRANGGTGTSATIAQGGTVTISYPTGSSMHNADFGSGSQPTSCAQTAGANSGSVPPLPHTPTSPGWSGTCK